MKKEIKWLFKRAKEELKNKNFWKIFWTDIIFILCLIIFLALMNLIVPAIMNGKAILFIMFSALLVLGSTAIYSRFKHKFLLNILGNKVKQNFLRFWMMNTSLILLAAFEIIILYSIINYFVLEEYVKIYFGILLLVFLIIDYTFINIIQILKIQKRDMEESIIIIKNNMKKYIVLFLGEMIEVSVIYGLLLLVNRMIGGGIILQAIANLLVSILIILYNTFNKRIFAETDLSKQQ